MPGFADWMKNAFAVEAPDAEPTEAQKAAADRICREVVRRGLTTPALMALEMSRPLNYLGAQAMHFFQPIVSALFDTGGYDVFAGFLEKRSSIDYLARRIEAMEAERDASTHDSSRDA